MRIFKNTFRTIWGAYGALIFLIEVLLYAPLLYLFMGFGSKRVKSSFLKKSYYYVPRVHFFPSLIRLITINQEKVDPHGQYIIVSNHCSIIDIFANPGASPVFFKYLSKTEVKDLPMLGKIASNFCVFVDRKNAESRKQSYLNMKQAIAEGHSILIYPEGTRNRTNEPLKQFYDGAFRLAIDTGTPIAVQTLVNSGNISSPSRPLDLCPGKIYSYWDDPIDTRSHDLSDIPALKKRVREIMMTHLEAGI